MNNRMIAAGLFAISLGLFAVAWSIHVHGLRQPRFAFHSFNQSEDLRLDMRSGRIEVCKVRSDGLPSCEEVATPPFWLEGDTR